MGLLGDPVSLVGYCRVCKEEKEARGTAVVTLKKRRFKIEAEQEHCFVTDYLEAQAIRLTSSSKEGKSAFLSTVV